jgi:hypothetical protein
MDLRGREMPHVPSPVSAGRAGLGAEGDNQLHGFRGDTGETLFTEPHQAMAGLRHFQTLIATEDRLYVVADGSIYAFRF